MYSKLKFMEAFNPNESTIREFDYWIVLIRKDQVTLGDCIFALKREIPSFGEMTYAESAELRTVLKWYEEKCKILYGAVKFNYIAAMMRDNFVHFHAFPRYAATVERYGLIWNDERWPRVIQFEQKEVNKDILQMIISDMSS